MGGRGKYAAANQEHPDSGKFKSTGGGATTLSDLLGVSSGNSNTAKSEAAKKLEKLNNQLDKIQNDDSLTKEEKSILSKATQTQINHVRWGRY